MRSFKILLVVLLTVDLGFSKVSAQKAFEKSDWVINGGAVIYTGGIPITVSAEYGISKHFGIGIRSYFTPPNRGYSLLNGALYSNFHLSPLRQLDVFAGLHVDKTYFITPQIDTYRVRQPVGLNSQLGARYLFANRIGGYTQLLIPFYRGGEPSIELGISIKL